MRLHQINYSNLLLRGSRHIFCIYYDYFFSGTVKDDSLFYYIMHKKKFIKSLKRKDYVDAIEEIEADIRNDGTDGNEKGEDVLLVGSEALLTVL